MMKFMKLCAFNSELITVRTYVNIGKKAVKAIFMVSGLPLIFKKISENKEKGARSKELIV